MRLKGIVKKHNETKILLRRISAIKNVVRNIEYETCKNYLKPSEATENYENYYDFEFFDLGGTIYNEGGKARLCENLTLYSKRGNPIMDIEL